MNWIDIVIIVYLIISVISGAAQGLIRSVLSLLGIIIGVVLAANFYKQLGGVFGFINNDTIAKVIAFLIIVGVVMIVASIIGSALK
ncbi:MAG: CvpA family protein, partial [Dehalococcoidia bacterium]|nr:CvpA family protein [Dehalococcoidia bacterium]